MAKNVASHIAELREFAVSVGLMKPKNKKGDGLLSKDMAAIKARVDLAYKGKAPKTPTGSTSTSREALEDSGNAVLERFAEVGKWEKFNTYVPTLEQATTVPLNTSANPLLSTGRVSYNGLIQLMPRKGGIRECFQARPGTVWSSVDYSAIEMVTLAQVCLWTVGESDLAAAINAGQDPHCILGADLLGIDYSEFTTRLAAKDELVQSIRQAGKAGNFGYPGMMGPLKFVVAQKRAGFSVCEWFFKDGQCGGANTVHDWDEEPLEQPLCLRCIEQSVVVRKKYLARWREVPRYWKWVMNRLNENDAITQFVSQRVRGSPHGPAAANTLFQGLAADGAKRAVVKMTKEMYLDQQSPLFGSRLMAFPHDETIIEIPEEKGHEAAHRQAAIMVAEMRKVTPDVKVKAEPALMRNWWKAAEPVYVDGRLVPWMPKEEAK